MRTKLLTFLPFFHKNVEKDVFKRTQSQLTIVYSGLVILFLVLFIFIVFGLLYAVINRDQERSVKSLASQEAKIIENYMIQNQQRDLLENQEVVLAGVDQFFYYVVSPEGELIMGQEDMPMLRAELFRLVKDWNPKQNEDIRHVRLRLEHSNWKNRWNKFDQHELNVPPMQDNIRLMIAGEPLFYKGQFVGTIYVGKDITVAYSLFKWVGIVLGGLTVVFSGVAFYMSKIMSRRAMVPIAKSFNRQREFVADASHELRTPLSVLLSSIDAMEMTIDTEEDDFSRKVLFNMKDEVKRMTNLVSDLLTLARSDSDRVELKTEIFDFRQNAEKAIASLEPLAASKQIKLTLHATENVIVQGDSEKLSQLLYILIDNGIKYTPNGGTVDLNISNERNELFIQVKDTGIGIQPEDHKRIFDRFYRADKSRARQMGSHGLGLAIAKWIVDIHKGTIQVNSEIGKGSSFNIRIPFSISKKA